ncbi:AAA family ATPase [Halalkalibacter krulwichiae]|uniref:Stage V sporulation protein K n=1 Tax=Halalkalibacter krulwichiae TaxID=199441 RepID=A0A1X9ME68_9BACI|nr:AAA family ATPase [Halalkalibacter krulwichiae]ARK30830.1 Stage V sporulation protein K [Halalkalibacter krulwichiae]
MLQENWTDEMIRSWIEQVYLGKERFHEGKAWELLELLEQSQFEEKKRKHFKSVLLSKLAEARLNRIGKIDHLIERWTKEAIREDNENILAHELKVDQFIEFLKQIPIPNKFPQIRETDHGSAKKKTAREYEKIAECFFQFSKEHERFLAQIQPSIAYAHHSAKETKIKETTRLMQQLQGPFQTILTSARDYANSLTGVYYSASQFGEITKATREIEQLLCNWNEELTEFTKTKQEKNALDELQYMIGLEDVKDRIKKLYQFLHYQKERMKQGFHTKDGINLHMILQGNPGTGKTHLARLIAKIYYELGLLERDEVYEVDRSQLVGAFVGQTEENTMKAIERAKGGVLFIDEAYSLRREGASGNDYGQVAIDTLVSAMTNEQHEGHFAVFLAGYPAEMRKFLRANPGLRSRFPDFNHIEIHNYTLDELLEIGELVAIENDFLLTSMAKKEFKKRLELTQVDDSFGNARTAKNIILDAIFEKGANVVLDQNKLEDFVLLQAEDFKELTTSRKEEHAIEDLHKLIGLEQVKKEIQQLTSFVQIQQLRRDKGLQALPLQVHSVFTGNPGTGKTTVAKLFAKSLKEIGLLKRGHLIVASRADLVAGYVGQTAEKTKEKIKDALGGVLFIDEAYSLFSRGESDFGKEVINTLVQEMTEHEENLVVILAGYANEMNQLLNSNPGLVSRFKKHIAFPDYTKKELLGIIEKRAAQHGYYFADGAKEHLTKVFPEKGHPANGRFAADIFDQLAQIQSLRLVTIEHELNDKQLAEIEKVDIDQLSLTDIEG